MHTKGPWKADMDCRHYGKPCIRHNGQIICYFHELSDRERDHNVSLIASAPDLLEACNYILFHLDNRPSLKHRKDLFTDDERDKLRKAISKAEGREGK